LKKIKLGKFKQIIIYTSNIKVKDLLEKHFVMNLILDVV